MDELLATRLIEAFNQRDGASFIDIDRDSIVRAFHDRAFLVDPPKPVSDKISSSWFLGIQKLIEKESAGRLSLEIDTRNIYVGGGNGVNMTLLAKPDENHGFWKMQFTFHSTPEGWDPVRNPKFMQGVDRQFIYRKTAEALAQMKEPNFHAIKEETTVDWTVFLNSLEEAFEAVFVSGSPSGFNLDFSWYTDLKYRIKDLSQGSVNLEWFKGDALPQSNSLSYMRLSKDGGPPVILVISPIEKPERPIQFLPEEFTNRFLFPKKAPRLR